MIDRKVNNRNSSDNRGTEMKGRRTPKEEADAKKSSKNNEKIKKTYENE